jgi:trk system potassium uptake protein TrkA
MNIIIVGAGKVGRVLTEYLLEEEHDITIIDILPDVVEEMSNNYDVKAIVGNGASYETLNQADINKTNILIAMTESDEVNILSCLVAKKLGVLHTIARVRNPEYATQHNFLIDDLGLNLIVNPEYEAAKDIARMLKYPSATRVDFFANEQVEIVEIALTETSLLVGNSLSQLRSHYGIRFLVSAVVRNGNIFIPGGDFFLQENDKICITGAPNDIDSLFKKLGILKNRARNVMVVGGGKITYYLGMQLLEQNTNLKIVEVNRERCNELAKELPRASVILGDGSTQEVLLEENVENMDALVTLTGFDEENIVISLFAKALKIPKIITKVNRYVYTNIFDTIGLESIK